MEIETDGEKMPERRKFLRHMVKSPGAATADGLALTGYLESSDSEIKDKEVAEEERMSDTPNEAQTVTPRSEESPIDYLNKVGTEDP